MSIEEQLREHTEKDAEQFAHIFEALERIEQKLEPIADVYNGAIFTKKFVIGLSSFIIAIGAIGAGIMYVVSWIRHGGN